VLKITTKLAKDKRERIILAPSPVIRDDSQFDKNVPTIPDLVRAVKLKKRSIRPTTTFGSPIGVLYFDTKKPKDKKIIAIKSEPKEKSSNKISFNFTRSNPLREKEIKTKIASEKKVS